MRSLMMGSITGFCWVASFWVGTSATQILVELASSRHKCECVRMEARK